MLKTGSALPALQRDHLQLLDTQDRRLEFASRSPTLEQQVHLCERPIFRLRQAEVGPQQAYETRRCPEKAGFCTPVPGARIQLSRDEDVSDD